MLYPQAPSYRRDSLNFVSLEDQAFRSTLCLLGTVLNTLYTFVTEYKLNNLKHRLLNLLALILNHVMTCILVTMVTTLYGINVGFTC